MSDFTDAEHRILETLNDTLQNPRVQAAIDAVATRVTRKLANDSAATLAWEPVPLDIYRGGLPAAIRSSWVFVLRAGTTSGAERHPNSHQRVMAYRGRGDLQTFTDRAWRSNVLQSEPDAPLEHRWLSIPVNEWHKPVMGADDWVVVSFHTATDEELIEERGDPEVQGETRKETYAARSDAGSLGAR